MSTRCLVSRYLKLVAATIGGALCLSAITITVWAKAPTVKLTVAGGHLSRPLEVKNPAALVNVWSGTRRSESWFDFPRPFIGSVVTEPNTALPRYTVTFYTDAPELKKIYVVRYVPDPDTGLGFVYLPLRSEPGGGLNGIITRRGRDGHWLQASAEWSHVINAYLAAETGR